MEKTFRKTPCSGQIDRYRLRFILPELALSGSCSLKRFAALDTVSSQPVILESLPADFSLEAQLLLRKTLARQGIRQYSRVADWGLPVFMHEIWELDAAAAACSTLRSGDLLLVYDLEVEDSFENLLEEGSPDCCRKLLFSSLPQLCHKLTLPHQQGQGHGCLITQTLWLTSSGKIELTDFAVAALLQQLEKNIAETQMQEPTPADDLAALKKIALALAEKTGLSDTTNFKVALLQVRNLNDLQKFLENPPSEKLAQEKDSVAHPIFPPSDQNVQAKSSSRLINTAFFSAVGLLLILLGLWLWRAHFQPAAAVGKAEEFAARMRPPVLVTRNIQQPLGSVFATSFTLTESLTDTGSLGMLLLGQLKRIEIIWNPDRLQIFSQLGENKVELLVEHVWETPPPPGTLFQLLKTPTTLAVYKNQVFLASCSLEIQNWRQLKWQSANSCQEPPKLSCQKIGSLFFSDDFMHSDGALGEWEIQTGEWAVHALKTPVRSANPFSFIGKGENAEVTAGYWFWRNYRFRCAIKPLDASSFGVRLCSSTLQTSYRVMWAQDKSSEADSKLSLLRQADGKESVLAEVALPFPAGNWLELAVTCNESLLEVWVDGHSLLRVQDSKPLLGGKIALLSSGQEGTIFDDVQVTPAQTLQLPPTAELSESPLLYRQKTVASPIPRQEFIHSFRLNQPELSDAQLTLEVDAQQLHSGTWEMALQHKGYRELCFRFHSSEQNSPAKAEILLQKHGQEQLLCSETWQAEAMAGKYVLIFHTRGTEAWGVCNGKTIAFAKELPLQEPGFAVIRHQSSSEKLPSWLSVRCEPLPPLAPVVDKVAMFTHEESMRNWNNPVLEWISQGEQYWYQADFWQDLSLSMELPPLLQLSQDTEWGLLLGYEENSTNKNSASVRLFYQPQKQELILEQAGKDLLGSLKCDVAPSSIALQKCGDRLLARMNDKILWNVPLPNALQGLCLAGRQGAGNTLEWANAVHSLAAGIKSYSFQEAPCDWIAAGGTWEVTNRWQCDPRWSFFSGVNLEGAACLWNKFQHGDKVSIDFFVGPKMDTERGKKYEYAGDFSLVLAADGKDISSGYSFLFGGWDNRGSQIIRENRIVHENTDVKVPRSGAIHRRWFHMKIRKNGNLFRFWVDGVPVGDFTDPELLQGRHFGIWSWKNGLMVAQFRISSDCRTPATTVLSATPNIPRTPYD